MRGMKVWLAALLLILSLPVGGRTVGAVRAEPLANCRALTMYLRPGLNPPPGNLVIRVAPDAPTGRFPVSLPVYPGAVRLKHLLDTPYGASLSDDAYIQTAAAEYGSADAADTVLRWYQAVMPSCGWRQGSFWGTSSTSAFTSGHSFISRANSDHVVLVSVGRNGSSRSYLALGAEQVILPPRPESSYLHGPFNRTYFQVRIALKRSSFHNGREVVTVIHTTVTNHPAIARLVTAIDRIRGSRSVRTFCPGPPQRIGPAWLTFIRADGSRVHAFEMSPGACGGLSVNGAGWMIDPGGVWKQILGLSGVRR
jgi:hypothetical protein